MPEQHIEHGSTPANWAGAGLMMLAFTVGTLGVVIAQPLVFWIGVALIIVAGVVWKVMSGMGYNSPHDIG